MLSRWWVLAVSLSLQKRVYALFDVRFILVIITTSCQFFSSPVIFTLLRACVPGRLWSRLWVHHISLSMQGLPTKNAEDNWIRPLLTVGLSIPKRVCAPLMFIYTRGYFLSVAPAIFTLLITNSKIRGSWLSASLSTVWLLNELKITQSKLSSLSASLFRNVSVLLRFYLCPCLLVVVIFLSVATTVLTLLRLCDACGLWSNRWVHHVSLLV